MTGTGKVAEAEFLDTYAMSVIKIPTNRKKIRKDLPDEIYQTLPEKIVASLDYVKKVHEKGNPILVFAGSVEMSILYSNLLLREGILTIFSMLTMLLERPRSLRNQVEKEP